MKQHLRTAAAATLLALTLHPSAHSQTGRREVGNLVMEGIPEQIPTRITEKLDQYNNTRGAGLADWAPGSEGIIIRTRFGDVSQFHYVRQPGAYREQLTFYKEPISGGQRNPNPAERTFLFSKDVGGGENYQVFLMNLDSRQVTQLTDGKSRNVGPMWSHRGDQIAFSSNKRNGQDMDFYVTPAGNAADAKLILQVQGGGWGMADWREDGAQMLVGNYKSANEVELYTLDVASGKLERINPTQKQIAYGGALYAKDGKGAYIVSDEDTDFSTLRYYDFGTKRFTPLTNSIKWDVESMELNEQGTQLAFTTNEDGFSRLYLLDTRTNKYEQVPNLPMGGIGGLEYHPDGTRLALTMNTATTTSDVYVLNTGTKQTERWTYSELGGLNPKSFLEPEIIRYPTFDKVNPKDQTNRMIPAIMYKPKSAKGKMPVVIDIHGGPEGQSTVGFDPTTQYLVNEMGVAVILPNVRGSSGYGKEYLKLDNGYLRENSVKDIGALLTWIAKQPDLDASRVAVMGGSYGGYMTLACMTTYNDRLKAGIDIVGISNFVTFLNNTADYRRDLRRVEYGDERDPKMNAFQQKISPNNNVQKITKPMFIIQGKNDPRVPVTEAEQMVEALKKNGNPTWYLMATDEGHGFRKKPNRDFENAATMLFLEQYLVGNAQGGSGGSGK